MQQLFASFTKVYSLSHGFTFRVTQNNLNSSVLPPETWPTRRQSRLRGQQVPVLLRAPEEGISLLFWNWAESGPYHPALVFLKMGLGRNNCLRIPWGEQEKLPNESPNVVAVFHTLGHLSLPLSLTTAAPQTLSTLELLEQPPSEVCEKVTGMCSEVNRLESNQGQKNSVLFQNCLTSLQAAMFGITAEDYGTSIRAFGSY